MPDKFAGFADGAASPSRAPVAIVPSDTTDLPDVPKAIYVGTAGDVSLIGVDAPAGAAAVVFRNVPSGSYLDVRARRITATDTSADDLVALV